MTTNSALAVRLGPAGLPEHTLGWQQLEWTAEYLQQPDGPNAGEVLDLTDEQAKFLLWWSAVDPAGRFIYRYAMLRRMKGWGKDPMAAVVSSIEFVGPCRFSRWEDGKPIAEPHPAAWVQIAAVSKEQTRNTMTLFPGMLSQKAITEYEIDMGKEIIYAHRGRKRIEAVTSSPRALEGGRPTLVVKNETHHWLKSNEGHEMAKVIARNLAKSRDGSSRALAISNAHALGEDSDAERDWDAYQKIAQGLSTATGFLYDSLEAPEVDLDSDEAVKAAIEIARGDSHWVDSTRLLAEIRDPRTSKAMTKRFYFNQIGAEEDKPFDPERFTALTRHIVVSRGTPITLGFDGSRRRDHTALVATEIETGHQWVPGYWEPRPNEDGELWIPDGEVDEVVEEMFARYRVERFLVDPYYWFESAARWEGKWGEKVIRFPTNAYRKMAFACLAYRTAIESESLTHDGDVRLVAAITNSHKQMHEFRDDNEERMWTVQKEREDSPLKIDAGVAAILSWQARSDVLSLGHKTPSQVLPIGWEDKEGKSVFSGVRGATF